MNRPLAVPVLAAGTDVLIAALAYAEHGWYVVPVKRGRKDPGSVLGKDWPTQSSQDPKQISAWWAGTDYGIALHAGRSGALVFDVDHPDKVPDLLRNAVTVAGTPYQSTRADCVGRGHYVFRQPDGRLLGNSTGGLGTGWGEVRGANGVIMVEPSAHPNAAGRYQWQCTGTVPALPDGIARALPDAGLTADTVTAPIVAQFLADHVRNDHPGLLEQVRLKFTNTVDADGSRHDAAVDALTWALKEAQAGFYPASVAVDAIQRLFLNAVRAEQGRERAGEWDGILRWAVAQALADDPSARRDATEERLSNRTVFTPLDMTAPAASETKKEETTAPPAVDSAMFWGVLGRMVAAADPTTEADRAGVLVSLLAGASAAVGTGPNLQIGNTRHPLLVWPLIFGTTGSGRKGEATNTARRFLRAADPQADSYMVTGLSSGEGLIERIRDTEDEDDQGGTEDKRLLVTEPEFSSVMARTRREGSTLAAVLRQAWDGQALSVLNRAALHATTSHVSIIGHITPKEFRLRLAESEMAGGTYNRFLPVYVSKSKRVPLPQGVAESMINELAGELGEAIRKASVRGAITLDTEATTLWCGTLYDEFTEVDDEEAAWTEFARRAAPYCLRIAALYAVLGGQEQLGRPELMAAAALVRYSVASAKFVLADQTRNPRMDRLRRAVDQADRKGLTRTEVSNLFSRNEAAKMLDSLIIELVSSGQYEEFTVPTGGRPAIRYRRCAVM